MKPNQAQNNIYLFPNIQSVIRVQQGRVGVMQWDIQQAEAIPLFEYKP